MGWSSKCWLAHMFLHWGWNPETHQLNLELVYLQGPFIMPQWEDGGSTTPMKKGHPNCWPFYRSPGYTRCDLKISKAYQAAVFDPLKMNSRFFYLFCMDLLGKKGINAPWVRKAASVFKCDVDISSDECLPQQIPDDMFSSDTTWHLWKTRRKSSSLKKHPEARHFGI